MWLFWQGEALHNRTGGEYDVVVWNARGKGAPSHSLTMYVVQYIAIAAQHTDNDPVYVVQAP